MAILQVSREIQSIRGKFGGTYFRTVKGRIIQSAMPRHVYNSFGGTVATSLRPYNPPEEQGQGSGEIGEASSPVIGSSSYNAYMRSWTAMVSFYFAYIATVMVAKAYWEEFAGTNKYKTKKGEERKLAPHSWFLHFNVARDVVGYLPYTRPPRSSLTLPQYVGGQPDEFGKYTDNANFYWKTPQYSDELYVEDVPFGSWHRPLYLARHGDTWYVSTTELIPDFQYYWYKVGIDPEGVYTPNYPPMGTFSVTP